MTKAVKNKDARPKKTGLPEDRTKRPAGKKVSLSVRLVKKSRTAPPADRPRIAAVPSPARLKEERREAVNREIADAVRISRPKKARRIDLMPPRETLAADEPSGRKLGLAKAFKSLSGRKERILSGSQADQTAVLAGRGVAAAEPALRRLAAEVDPVKEERAKRLMMWSGVLFFMLLITGGWLYNMKQSFNRSRTEAAQNFSLIEWRDLTTDLDERIEQMKEDLNDISSFVPESEAADGSLPAAGEKEPFISSSTLTLTSEEIEILKDKLAELENATSTIE